jgi:hypothetical protein
LSAAPLLFLRGSSASAQVSEVLLTPRSEAEQIAIDAYVYGYSLITTEVTRVQMSNVDKTEGMHAPSGQFANIKRYPPAAFRGVSAPNADTLYSVAWVDLTEPQVFSHPDMGKRFYLFEMTDLWMTDFNSPGTRTTGGQAANYLITGPGWAGNVPAGMKQIKCATRYMVILGRTYADGTDQDYAAAAHRPIQDRAARRVWQILCLPGASGNPNPGFSMTDAPQGDPRHGCVRYFNMMARLMGSTAPRPRRCADAGRMTKIGLARAAVRHDSETAADAEAALKDLGRTTPYRGQQGQPGRNGERLGRDQGPRRLRDRLHETAVAAFGWPANLPQDAVYPYTEVDGSGQKLSGANRYTLTFAKGQTPPVSGFWSITMYQIDQGWWFVPNPLNRFTVSLRDNPKYSPDGSLTLYFQNESPGKDLETNWLPAPKGDFIAMLRMYWPKENNPSIVDGTWKPPAITRV